ncbi:hypothetical protein PENTCL1PPCAC_19467 [Pristionchus entomophagus]|uniref:TRUD domain-containing protein n=1 Tax=Pristionchus entomophagus TaxID=358040 RepID=A0AAV5TSY6_9BILA|nr:hypothetical protein PENTCL1PPCAC_19467 [Pristionchus entomophagus]
MNARARASRKLFVHPPEMRPQIERMATTPAATPPRPAAAAARRRPDTPAVRRPVAPAAAPVVHAAAPAAAAAVPQEKEIKKEGDPESAENAAAAAPAVPAASAAAPAVPAAAPAASAAYPAAPAAAAAMQQSPVQLLKVVEKKRKRGAAAAEEQKRPEEKQIKLEEEDPELAEQNAAAAIPAAQTDEFAAFAASAALPEAEPEEEEEEDIKPEFASQKNELEPAAAAWKQQRKEAQAAADAATAAAAARREQQPKLKRIALHTMPTPEQLLSYGMAKVRTTDDHGLIECSTMDHSAKQLEVDGKWRHSVIMRGVAQSDQEALVQRLQLWSQRGFINYCGFNERMKMNPRSAEIGKYILQGRWEDAARGMGLQAPTQGADWESRVLSVERDVSSLFVRSYQTLLWNKFVSDRVFLYGATIFDIDTDINHTMLGSFFSRKPFLIAVSLPCIAIANSRQDKNNCLDYEYNFYEECLEEDGLKWDCFERASRNFNVGPSEDLMMHTMFERPTNVDWSVDTAPEGGLDAKLTVIIHFDLPALVDAPSAMREITSMAPNGQWREGKTWTKGNVEEKTPRNEPEEVE